MADENDKTGQDTGTSMNGMKYQAGDVAKHLKTMHPDIYAAAHGSLADQQSAGRMTQEETNEILDKVDQ